MKSSRRLTRPPHHTDVSLSVLTRSLEGHSQDDEPALRGVALSFGPAGFYFTTRGGHGPRFPTLSHRDATSVSFRGQKSIPVVNDQLVMTHVL